MDEQQPTKRHWLIRRWKIVIGVFLALVAAFIVYRSVLAARVQNQLAAIRAQGYPVTLEEL